MWVQNISLPFRHPSYVVLAFGVAWLVFSMAVWLANVQLIRTVFYSDLFTLTDKLSLPFTLYASIGTNFSVLSAITTIIIAFLFGVQIALLWYYIRRRQGGGSVAGATSLSGVISGFFGIGCAACGSLLITSLFSLIGAAGLLALLPLRGQEFSLLGIALIVFSIYLLAQKLADPLTCNSL